jgi:hypothetical protein
MAKFRPGPLCAEIHGSIGGITFADSRNGQIVRPRCPGKSNHTEAQIQSKTNFGSAARAWSNLDSAHKLAWNRAAVSVSGVQSNTTQRLSGFQLWMKTYSCFAGSPSITSSAVPAGAATPPLVLQVTTPYLDVPSLSVAFYSISPLPDTVIFARGAQTFSFDPKAKFRCWRWLGSGLYADSPLDFIYGWLDAFGSPEENQIAGLELFAVAPGHPPSVPLTVTFPWEHS